jgi:propionaldehyde dehydrogenase
VINRKSMAATPTYIAKESGVSYTGEPRLLIASVDENHPFVTGEMLMPVLGVVQCIYD